MRRYTYIYMLFLACGLFDTSNGASSTPTTAQASSEELVREAFAEFDRACEEYYRMSADVREWIYVKKNGIQIFNEVSKEYDKKAYNLRIYANHTSGTNLLDDDFKAKAEADLANINLKKYYDETLDKNEKEEANRLYDEVTKTERELNRLSEDESLVHAFYKVVKERYNAMPEKMRNSIKEYEEDINFNSIYPNYREHGKKKADFEKAYQKICVYYNQMHRDKLQRNGKSLPSEYQENGAALNQEVNELISNYVDAKTTKEKNSAYELLTSQYNASDFIYNNHKIDSDLQLYRWFVKAQKHKGNIRDQVSTEDKNPAKPTKNQFNTAKQALESKIPDVDLRTLILDNMNNEEIKSLINEYLELEDIIENLPSIKGDLLLKKTDINNKIDTFIKDASISKEIIDILKELKKHIEWMDTMHMDHLDSDLQKDSRELKKYINNTTVISNTPLSEFIQNLEESIKRLISLQRKLDKTKDKEKIDLESSLEYLSKMINQQFAKIINNGTNDTLKSHISALPEFTFRDYTHTMKEDISKCVINYFKAKKELCKSNLL